MKKVRTYGILGSGVMGGVLFSLIRLADPKSRVVVCVRDTKKVAAWKSRGAIVVRNGQQFPATDIIILAIKPNDFSTVGIRVVPSTLVISVMAGVSIATIREKLGAHNVVRTMMNIAADHGTGLAVWYAPSSVEAEGRRIARAICAAAGEAQEVTREVDIDRATVILGSGPAFLLRALSNFSAAAHGLMISRKDAARMTQSALAAAQLLAMKESDIDMLVARIASKGGTTEAGLQVFDDAKMSAIWNKAIRAAYGRARALQKNIQ